MNKPRPTRTRPTYNRPELAGLKRPHWYKRSDGATITLVPFDYKPTPYQYQPRINYETSRK